MEGFENYYENKESINLVDFPFICRICLKRSDSRLFKVEDNLLDVFLTITNIDVRSTPSLPENMCHDCIKTLEDISFFIDISKSEKNFLPKIKNEQAEHGSSQKHVVKSEEYIEDSQYSKGFEICQICYSTNILKPVEEKEHLMQLFQNITNIYVKAEVVSSNRNSICNKCVNKLEAISLFISVSLRNEIKLKKTIGRNEILETENCSEETAFDLGYRNKVKRDDDFYENKSLHSIVDIIKEEIVDTPELFIEQSNQIGIKKFSESHSEENLFDFGPCKEKFSTDTHMENQLKGSDIDLEIQSEANRFKCDRCDKSFSQKHSLQSHLLTHTGERPFKCDCCNTSFSLRQSLKRHLLTHTGEKPFKCDYCERSFTQKYSVKKHLLTHTGETPFKCDICEKSFPRKQGLKTHLLAHTAEKPFKCDCCKKRFTSKSNLKQHMLIHEGRKPYKCDSCEKRFTLKSNLQQHMLIHFGDKPFKCDCCNTSFSLRQSLKRHLLTHTGEKPFKCDYCERSFTQKYSVKKHLLTHSGEKPFKCDCCGKSFTQKGTLQQHMLIHSGEKPFKCSCCEKSFINKLILKRHLLTHTGERPFKCGYCEKSFTHQDSLKSHLLNHTGEKPFKCYCCKKGFNRKGSLQQHMLIHSGEKSFECGRCNKIFYQKGNLKSHMLIHEKYQR